MTAAELRRETRLRAGNRCEYCGLRQEDSLMSFHIEHILPKQHGGASVLENLALSCPSCNLRKGPNLTGIDPDSGEVCRLFHPRLDRWPDHFRKESALVLGISAIGRTTAWLLAMNSEEQASLRGE
ncbi:MAG TPA: HNH endonuclease [Verrucomicrobiales bacterium]|nr:HNH endonuclease [Verrucomicrobiales bacterium]